MSNIILAAPRERERLIICDIVKGRSSTAIHESRVEYQQVEGLASCGPNS